MADKEYRPANMAEWQKVCPLMESNSIEAVLPENPKNVFQVEKALKQLKFRKAMCQKYKNWFASYFDYTAALHCIDREFLKGLELVQRVASQKKAHHNAIRKARKNVKS